MRSGKPPSSSAVARQDMPLHMTSNPNYDLSRRGASWSSGAQTISANSPSLCLSRPKSAFLWWFPPPPIRHA